jgi:hypothetical protein
MADLVAAQYRYSHDPLRKRQVRIAISRYTAFSGQPREIRTCSWGGNLDIHPETLYRGEVRHGASNRAGTPFRGCW